MDKKPLQKLIVALLVGGAIAVSLHLLGGSGLGLAILNALVYTVSVRLLMSVPDLLRSPPTGTFDARSGYGAALLAVLLVAVPIVVHTGGTSPTGLAALVFGVGIMMWTFGVWFERAQTHGSENGSE